MRFEIAGARAPVPAFAIRHRGEVRGYRNICPHAGTELDWLPGQFFDESGLYLVCATHGAMFEPDTGLCVAGPCRGRKLAGVRLEERDGAVVLIELRDNE